ncbi:MAG: DUF669 domain-containing protein [Bacteroidales bacterium]|nr:DUF669 domain-containing protein [Bacteroidales bacterium]
MANLNGFDANQVEPTGDFDPVPAGQYLAVITESEMRPTKSGIGSYLQLTFAIIDGEHKGHRLWARLNLNNPNAMAVSIARAELAAICRAVGVLAPQDSVELHNLPLVVHVKCKKRDDTGDITNEVKGYSPKNAESSAATKLAAPSANGGTTNRTPPWKR